jgi:hypothetical protein
MARSGSPIWAATRARILDRNRTIQRIFLNRGRGDGPIRQAVAEHKRSTITGWQTQKLAFRVRFLELFGAAQRLDLIALFAINSFE